MPVSLKKLLSLRKISFPVLILCVVIGALAILHFLSRLAERSARIDTPDTAPGVAIALESVSYAALPGWTGDNLELAIPVFLRSCDTIWQLDAAAAMNPLENSIQLSGLATLSGEVGDWQGACAVAQKQFGGVDPVSRAAARAFFERFFLPLRVTHPELGRDGVLQMTEQGLITGYFEPVYEASSVQTPRFSAPVLPRPDDLIDVDLGQFKPSLAGVSVTGRLAQSRLVPYDDHQTIMEQGIDEEPLAWMTPDDLLFLQIQGSGKLDMDGEIRRIGYAGKNGLPYTPIGKILIERQEISREEMSMQTIRDWLRTASPREAAALRYENRSYVFFKYIDNQLSDQLGPVGAQGVQLTAMRSLAVDRRFYTMGMPIFVALSTALEDGGPLGRKKEKFRQLMITQDTGGAITGAVRGDIFTGSGEVAGRIAGPLRARGSFYILLPKALAMRVINDARTMNDRPG